jgi:phenylalanyl-tRNA synthetase alpha chain
MTSILADINECNTINQCIELRNILLNSGRVEEIKIQIKDSTANKQELGAELSSLRLVINNTVDERIKAIQQEQLKDTIIEYDNTWYDPKYKQSRRGNVHPITSTIDDIVDIFQLMGFDIYQGSDVLDQWSNFTSVNTPQYHPARDMQDTFFLDINDKDGSPYVMKTQSTSNFAEYAAAHKPPFRTIFPARVYRNESIDATHDVNFYQFDLWMVEKNMSLNQLTTLMTDFFKKFFRDPELKVRFRPSFFPFVNPGLETEIYSDTIKGGSWVEVCGSGLIDPKVLTMAGIDPAIWSGIAWGFGIERLMMLRSGLDTITDLYNGDLKFVRGIV